MKRNLRILSAAALTLTCGAANAIAISAVQASPGMFTTKSGVCTVDFNSPASLTACAGATYSANAASHIVSGSSVGQYAQPDPTPYLTVGGDLADPVTIAMTVGANYFGFFAGSIDSYNSLTFTGVSGSVTLTGDQFNAFLGAGGDADGSKSSYFNVFTDSLYTSVSLNSTAAAFETDNHSFGVASPARVPEPESVALLGLGALALLAVRRRASK